MVLTAGARLGGYEIVALLGAGGMGEVYRARDPKLNREVAIKVLLASVMNDPERLARFGREAQLLAALNHPNIAHIHGLEESNGVRALVMELVEGPTLADRITQGAIPLDEALPIAKQIAEALEAAHEQGIIHRDLKPANIKVRADGTIKVLDFGLAKALDPAGASGTNASISPTLSIHATQAGVILGTAAYMAPEQARGKVVDRRADIWAFGCVLFEMLTGTRAFKADDVTDTIVAVVSKEPDWQGLPTAASGVRPLLARCLRKDPKQRLQAIGDARIRLEELISGVSDDVAATRAPAATSSRRVATVAIAALAVGAVVATGLTWVVTRPEPHAPLLTSRFEIVPPPAQSLAIQGADRDIAISPDGRYIVYRAGAGLAQLVVRAIDRLDARPLAGVVNARTPFFSPDSQWIAFMEGTSLKRVSIAGGSAITICQCQASRGASWGEDNSIVFADVTGGLLRVSAGGGEPTALTTPDVAKGEKNHGYPSVLPGSRGVLFTVGMGLNPEQPQVTVLDLTTGERKTLIRGGSQAEYLQSGHLVYAAAGTLRVVRFDVKRFEVLSDPVPVVDDVWMASGGAAGYAVSRLGTLVYVPAKGAQMPRSLVWVDRAGQETPIRTPVRTYSEPRLSPDGTRVALTIRDQDIDLWIWDFVRETLTRLTSDPGADQRPVWTPDGNRILFASQRAGAFNIFAQAADGSATAEQLTSGADSEQYPAFVARDGTGIVGIQNSSKTSLDIVRFRLTYPTSRPVPAQSSPSTVEPLIQTTFSETNAEISPDGRYLAYQSNESGRGTEIYVRPFPRVNDGRWQASTRGGTRPLWARNGRELFYLDPANTLTAVAVQTSGATFAVGIPTKVFDTTYAAPLNNSRTYDVSPDGQRFLMIKENAGEDRNPTRAGMVVVLNMFEELKAKPPTGR
jgi:tRNA A-37 threonylcarbamoyl transferase component Bud32